MTVHELTSDLDAGGVVHQTRAELVRGDSLHELSCRAVQSLIDDIPKLVTAAMKGELKPPVPHRTSGRLWRVSDWRPDHLRLVYEYYKDGIVDAYLDGKIGGGASPIIQQDL